MIRARKARWSKNAQNSERSPAQTRPGSAVSFLQPLKLNTGGGDWICGSYSDSPELNRLLHVFPGRSRPDEPAQIPRSKAKRSGPRTNRSAGDPAPLPRSVVLVPPHRRHTVVPTMTETMEQQRPLNTETSYKI